MFEHVHSGKPTKILITPLRSPSCTNFDLDVWTLVGAMLEHALAFTAVSIIALKKVHEDSKYTAVIAVMH